MTGQKRRYTITGRNFHDEGTQQPAKRSRLEAYVKTELHDSAVTSHVNEATYLSEGSFTPEPNASVSHDDAMVAKITEEQIDDRVTPETQPAHQLRVRLKIRLENREGEATDLEPSVAASARTGNEMTDTDHIGDASDELNRGSRSDGNILLETPEHPDRDASDHTLETKAHFQQHKIASRVSASIDDPIGKARNLVRDYKIFNGEPRTSQSGVDQKQHSHNLSIYEKLPADAPWSHAHIILHGDSTPYENLVLPDENCVLPDMLVSAIYKYSPEALDAFLDIDEYPEFWFLCLMPARSTHYNWSICRRKNNVQVALLNDLKLPDESLETADSVSWAKIASKHNFPATFDYTFISASKPWHCPEKLPIWSTAFTEFDLNLRRGVKIGDPTRDDLLDMRSLYLYKYIRKHVFEDCDYKSLEADWGQSLRYHALSRRVRGFVDAENSNWYLGHTVNDLPDGWEDSDTDDSGSEEETPGEDNSEEDSSEDDEDSDQDDSSDIS